MKLLLNALTKLTLGAVMIGVMLFLPAGTLDYPGAWLFIALLFIPMTIMGTVLILRAPELLKKRLDGKEKAKTQKGVVSLSALMFPATFLLCAFDFRFGWSNVPRYAVITASIVFLIGYAAYAEVMRENAYLSRKIEIQDGQRIVDTGLYGIVRHPMYLATLLMFISMPIILGSLFGLIPMLLYPILIVIRLLDEEKLLTSELSGYREYKDKVHYRLIPFVW